MKTSLQVEYHPTHPSGPLVRALLRMEGEVPEDERRVPLNLSLVLDRSGSMAGGKLDAVKNAARSLIQRLHPEDRVSVVSFDDDVRTEANPGTAADQAGLLHALMGIQPGGLTNLSGGWLQGRALVQEHHREEGVNRVLLLTDGLANRGTTDPSILKQICAQALSAQVTTTTVGVGEGFDETLLAGMADAGGGSSYYIETMDQAGEIFAEELEGLLSIAAQNLSVEIRVQDSVELAAVHHGYTGDTTEAGDLKLQVGDLYAREPRDLLADFALDAGVVDATEPAAVVVFVIEADVWAEDGSLERRRVTLPVTVEPGKGAVTHPEVLKVFTLLEAARVRREAVERGDRGDLKGASNLLRDAGARYQASAPNDPELQQEARDLERLADSMDAQATFSSQDRKYLDSKARHYSRSRRSAGDRTTRE